MVVQPGGTQSYIETKQMAQIKSTLLFLDHIFFVYLYYLRNDVAIVEEGLAF